MFGGIAAYSLQLADSYIPAPRNPAPIGIADYGIGPNGSYSYYTESFVGLITLDSLATVNDASTSIQLNVFFSVIANGTHYMYWIQNIAGLWPSHRQINFGSYIFNFSGGPMQSRGIIGNGQVLSDGSYWCYNSLSPGQNAVLAYPSTVLLNLTCGITPSNQPYVDFCYDDGFGLVSYDQATFNVANVSSYGFVVSGFGGYGNNVELVFCGAGSNQPTITFTQADINLRLEFWNGHNYQMVPNSYNFGRATAESASNALSQLSYDANNGAIYAKITAGNGSLGLLYYQNMTSTIDITSVSSGVLYIINPINGSYYDQIIFSDNEVSINVFPGYYNLIVYQNDLYYDQGNFTLQPNQVLLLKAQENTPIPSPTPIPPTPSPTAAPTIIPTQAPTSNPTLQPTSIYNPTTQPTTTTSTATPIPTVNTPTPTVTELSGLIAFPLFLSLFSVAFLWKASKKTSNSC
jgi:hypothetical protein